MYKGEQGWKLLSMAYFCSEACVKSQVEELKAHARKYLSTAEQVAALDAMLTIPESKS